MRRIAIGIVIVLMLLTGFSNVASAVKYVHIATGSIGGSYYPLGKALAEIWNKAIPNIQVTPLVTGGTVSNIQMMQESKAQIAFLDGLYYYAYQGMEKYEGNPQKFIRAMTPLYPEPVQLMVAKDSGIRHIGDFRGKRISIGAKGSGTEVTARQLLKAAGLNPEKDIQGVNLGVYETAKAFRKKQIDAAIMVGTLEMAGVKEANEQNLVEFIGIPNLIIRKVIYETPYWVPFTIPANTYKGQDKDIKTYASWNILAVHQDLDAELVYQLTKHFFASRDKLEICRKTMKTATPENIKYILIPLHEGARKYYNELEKVTP